MSVNFKSVLKEKNMENNVKSSMKLAPVIAVLAGAADASAPEETTADDTNSTSASPMKRTRAQRRQMTPDRTR